jgi:tight adherence protein C
MDALQTLLDAVDEDGTLILLLLGLVGAGLVIFLIVSFLRGRSDVRRRATAEDKGSPTGRKPGSRADAQQSLNRLMTYVESTFAGGNEKENRVLRRQMIQAGFFDARAVPIYFAARLGLAVSFGLGAVVLLPIVFDQMTSGSVWMWSALLGLAGYLSPSFYLKRRIARRIIQHRMGFPDFMDLMVVCAEAGLSMEASIDRIARELVEGYPSLAENLYMASLEIRAGKAFPEALERMGERVGIEEASMLATLLQQSAELGTSLSQSLRVYSDEMRNKRMSRAEEKAYALPAKLVIPLTLFVFPVLIITLMLPVGIRVSGAFAGGG